MGFKQWLLTRTIGGGTEFFSMDVNPPLRAMMDTIVTAFLVEEPGPAIAS